MGNKKRLFEVESKLSRIAWNLEKLQNQFSAVERKANSLHVMDLSNVTEPEPQEKDLKEISAFIYSVWSSAGTKREAALPVVVRCSLKAVEFMKMYSISAVKLYDMLKSLTDEDIERMEEELAKMTYIINVNVKDND
jgi:hypothetical protein